MRAQLRSASYAAVVVFLLSTEKGHAQEAAALHSLREAVAVQQIIEREGAWLGPAIWPGFRPDTVAMLHVVPGRGKLFAHHRESEPAGFRPYPNRRGWSWAGPERVSFSPGHIAFLTTSGDTAATLGLAVHEAFHEYQEEQARAGIVFGRRENALHVIEYPVFDAGNEAGVAIEARQLSAALRAASGPARAEHVREFLAVRRDRRAALPERFATFEMQSELNEGLAQYALLRALSELRAQPGFPWREAAAAAIEDEVLRLRDILDTSGRSVRRRFYTTGAAIGLLLDEMSGNAWKEVLMTEDVTLDDLLARYAAGEPIASVQEIRMREGRGIERLAARITASLAAERAALRDSLLDRRGTRLELRIDSAGVVQWCGFDPQNTLAAATGEVIHARWLRLCAGGSTIAEFNGGVVQQADGRSYVVILGDTAELSSAVRSWTAGAEWPTGEVADLQIESPELSLRLRRALIRRAASGWVVHAASD
ncbi:MAG TPA: hypothetical protein VMN78_07785 [Longimicrobiales bacterium]|nr:hypothetical protein [Longimicrobiales bacterium]